MALKKTAQQHNNLPANATRFIESRAWYTAGAANADGNTGNDGTADGRPDENPEDKVRGFLPSQIACYSNKVMRAPLHCW